MYTPFQNIKKQNNREDLTDIKKTKLLSAAALTAFFALSILAFYFLGQPMLRFAGDTEKLRGLVNEHGFAGRLCFVGMVILQVLAAIIPGEPLEIAAGYVFGAFEGTVLCLVAEGIGSCIVILLVRRWGICAVRALFGKEKLERLRFLCSTPRRRLLFLALFTLPGTPKDLLCFFAGLTDIELPALLAICSLGRLPSVVTSTLGGDALGAGSYMTAAAVFAVTLTVSAVGLWLYDRVCSTKNAGIK